MYSVDFFRCISSSVGMRMISMSDVHISVMKRNFDSVTVRETEFIAINNRAVAGLMRKRRSRLVFCNITSEGTVGGEECFPI
jgi:hypothetical protein